MRIRVLKSLNRVHSSGRAGVFVSPKHWVVVWLASSVSAFAQPTWFTISGDPEAASANTIQVDPVSVDRGEGLRMMKVRVNRATLRTSWDGVPYRSYESEVLFDCRARTARYASITFFSKPLWDGGPAKTVDYMRGTPRMMEFRGVEPNPTQRIVTAACATAEAPRR
jgi:hypothetical protein